MHPASIVQFKKHSFHQPNIILYYSKKPLHVSSFHFIEGRNTLINTTHA